MRVSQHYGLTGNQGTFDFIDVHIERDTPLFIDPSVIASLSSPWAGECVSSIQNFFQRVLDHILAGDTSRALGLLSRLGEDNSTRLGYSGRSRGSGLGAGLAAKFYRELSTSQALRSGLITDLEDTALLIEGIREDRISDVTTNIIRKQLVEYTQATAAFYGIPLVSGIVIGPFWESRTSRWTQATVDLPVAGGAPLLLVPKSIVRRVLFHDPSEYYRHYVLEYFREDELLNRSPLTYTIKSGQLRVHKVDVEKKYRRKHGASQENPGVEKRINVDGTSREPDLLRRFKAAKAANPPEALDHETLGGLTSAGEPDYDALLQAVLDLPTGAADATAYEKAIEALFGALMYPVLVNPFRQSRIHDGRKIIDIRFTNMARHGFFEWLARHYPAPNVMVECKNYSRSLANPEFDQLSGRFSPSRGKYGLLVYRSYSEKARVMESLRDTARDDRGFMTALDDDDLAELVREAKTPDGCMAIGGLLHQRFQALTN
ncbi:hypothetical protein [Actinotalea sp. JY-7885]|uniref:hypothetical protein n=1 Tax=Actinotalea sp. JY-7885 TaxID=2758576 RepID=UPI00165DFE73|nr:hypothetical protein [Actinotalea sp. JY-7885]